MIGNALARFIKMYGPKAVEMMEKGEAGLGKLAGGIGEMAKANPGKTAAVGGASALAGMGLDEAMSDDPDDLDEEQLIELLRKKGVME